MVSAMSLKGLFRNYIPEGSLRRKSSAWKRRSSSRDCDGRDFQNEVSMLGTLQRGQKQATGSLSNSLVDYTDPARMPVVLEKQDDETFGFEIQTYGVAWEHSSALEMCTFVCNVQEHSPAENAGLTIGDIIVTVNGISTVGSTHQNIVELIQNSTNLLTMETTSGAMVKMLELAKKLKLLKKSLREKLVELHAVTLEEQRLILGNDALPLPTLDRSGSFSLPAKEHFSSDSSSGSILTEDNKDGTPLSHISEFQSPHSTNHISAAGDDCDFTPLGLHYPRGRACSVGLASSTGPPSLSPSPSWSGSRASTPFGTLLQKSGRRSVRKWIMKLTLGDNGSLKEEESQRPVATPIPL